MMINIIFENGKWNVYCNSDLVGQYETLFEAAERVDKIRLENNKEVAAVNE